MTTPADDKDLTGFDLTVPEKGAKAGGRNVIEEAERREVARLAEVAKRFAWPVRLPFDLAMQCWDDEEVFKRHEISPERAFQLIQNESFINSIKSWREFIVKEGISFKTKARMAAEDLLMQAYTIATDASIPPGTRLDAIKWHAKVAGLEPNPKDLEGGGGQGSGFTLKISFDGAPGQSAPVIQGEAKRLEEK